MRATSWTAGLALAVVLMLVGTAGHAAVAPPLLLVNGTIVTMDAQHRVGPDGHVLVGSNGVITGVWTGATPPGISTAGAHVVDAGRSGLVFPGLINIHSHAFYAALPIWPVPATDRQPDDGRPTGREPFDFRYEWGGGNGGQACWPSAPWSSPPEKTRLVSNAADALADGDKLGLLSQVIVHAEATAALGGETAIEGEPDDPANGLIVRDVDGNDFPVEIESRVKTVDHCFPDAAQIAAKLQNGTIDAWLVHLAEGVRNGQRARRDSFSSRSELTTLRKLHLLTKATVVVHGTALEKRDFVVMHARGAKLVWSPLSNLLLYGHTTNVYDALAVGVPVSLSTDWAPTGSKTLLDELKIASIVLRSRRLLGTFRGEVPALATDEALDQALVDMVTRNPAQALHWPVGSIEPGNHADLLVLDRPARTPTGGLPDSPYRSLIDATERDVRLVVIDGKPVAGDAAVVAAAGAGTISLVRSVARNYRKAIAYRRAPPAKLRLSSVERILGLALHSLGGDGAARASGQPGPTATFSFLHARWNHGNDKTLGDQAFRNVLAQFAGTAGGRLNLERIELSPLLTDDDHFFFTVVEGRRTRAGLPADRAPPFRLYPANVNQAAGGPRNPFAVLYDRWYR